MAIAAYNSGIDHKDKGLKLEATAARPSDAKERAKVEDKAKKEYEKALKDFKSAAVRLAADVPGLQRHGLRLPQDRRLRQGARDVRQGARRSSPGFPDAIEYRGEAYLGLNRVDDAKQAYLEMLAADRKQADTLMAAMQNWVAAEEDQPGRRRSGRRVRARDLDQGARRDRQGDAWRWALSHGPRW